METCLSATPWSPPSPRADSSQAPRPRVSPHPDLRCVSSTRGCWRHTRGGGRWAVGQGSPPRALPSRPLCPRLAAPLLSAAGPSRASGLPETRMGPCLLSPCADCHLLLRAFWTFGAEARFSIGARICSRHSLLTLLLTRGSSPRHCLCKVTGAAACVLRCFHSPGLVVFLPSLPQTREMGAQGPGVGPGLWGLNSGARAGWELGSKCLVPSAKAEFPRARAPRWLLTGSAGPAALQPLRVLSPSSRQESSWGG